jgi:SAM-dependent methyltransferase
VPGVCVHAEPRPQGAGLSAAGEAYDRLAPDYDLQVSGDDWMRQALHAHYARVFRSGQRVLDVGCGSGIDALALAQRGVRVLGIDASAGMIQRARERVGSEFQPLLEFRVLDATHLSAVQGEPFDGAISAFAALNTLPDLAAFARDLASVLRPGGRAVVHILNRFSSWEFLGLVLRRRWRGALHLPSQRQRTFTIGGVAVRHTLYTPAEAARAFRPHFSLVQSYGFGALRPPHTVRRIPPRVVYALERLDLRFGRVPGIKQAGRFVVLDLERRATAS